MYCSLIYTVVFFIKHNHQETDITNHSDDITAEKILKGQKVLDSYQQKQKNLTQKQRHKTLYTYIYQGKTYQQWMSISEVAIMISIIVSFFLAREE